MTDIGKLILIRILKNISIGFQFYEVSAHIRDEERNVEKRISEDGDNLKVRIRAQTKSKLDPEDYQFMLLLLDDISKKLSNSPKQIDQIKILLVTELRMVQIEKIV